MFLPFFVTLRSFSSKSVCSHNRVDILHNMLLHSGRICNSLLIYNANMWNEPQILQSNVIALMFSYKLFQLHRM